MSLSGLTRGKKQSPARNPEKLQKSWEYPKAQSALF